MRVPIKTNSPLIENFRNKINFKKGVIPIVGLVLVLLIGFYIFQKVPSREEKEIKTNIESIQYKIDEAQNASDSEANNLLQEAWTQVLSLGDATEAQVLKETIKTKLNEINKLEIIEDPEIVKSTSDLKELASLSGTDLLFTEPNTLSILKRNVWTEKKIDPPSFRFNPTVFTSYFSNLYLLDKDTCEIAKYSHLSGTSWGSGKKWLDDKSHCQGPKSIAVDGSLYILNSDNTITVHHSGQYVRTISLDIFPKIENITKIKTKINVPYLYLLEPKTNRVVVIDKEGDILKQFQSEEFNNLTDFDISSGGKTIYLLNKDVIYKITI